MLFVVVLVYICSLIHVFGLSAQKIALKLVNEFHEEYGVRVIIDTQVYEPARIVRLDLSIHSGIKVFSLPFKPYMLEKLTWDKIRELQRSPK